MSELDTSPSVPTDSRPASSPGRRLLEEPNNWLDAATMVVSDRCSPILVKESRQALKSRQFQWTFLALLLAVVGWSLVGVSNSFRNNVEEYGATMLVGYLFILGFPLAVVIPMAAFRSLAREYEDETIQLVSITSMSARRIILGKLGSAFLQIIMYLAAVTPCIVFSYILRGISFSMIWMGLSLALSGGLCLTCLALAVAGACRNVFLRVGANLVLLVGLLGTYVGWISFVGEVFTTTSSSMEEFVYGANTVSVIFVSFGLVLVEATTSLISFYAENRSTRLRLILLAFPTIVLASFAGLVGSMVDPTEINFYAIAYLISAFGSHYFTIIGTMCSSERSGLSNRVRRSLPRGWLGRAFWGLLYPGPGRGYLFALVGVTACNICGVILLGLPEVFEGASWLDVSMPTGMDLIAWISVNQIFAMLYLSLIYLSMLWLESYAGAVKVLVGLMLAIILYVLAAVASFTIHETAYYSDQSMSSAYYINWVAMLESSQSSRVGTRYDFFACVLFVGVPTFCLTVVAYLVAIRELVATATSVPQRVLEDGVVKTKLRSTAKGESFEEIFQQRRIERDGDPTSSESND